MVEKGGGGRVFRASALLLVGSEREERKIGSFIIFWMGTFFDDACYHV